MLNWILLRVRQSELWPRISQWSLDIATWDKLRGLSQSPVIRLTVVMPILGYLILFNDKLNEFGFLTISNFFAPDAWSRLRLYLLYFGFWAFAVGVVMFQIWCPRQIKQHGASWEYIDHEGPSIGAAQLGNICRIVIISTYSGRMKLAGLTRPNWLYAKLILHTIAPIPNQTLCDLVNIENSNDNEKLLTEIVSKMETYKDREGGGVNDMLTNYYEAGLRFIFPTVRRTIFVTYAVGVAAIGLPAVELLWRVSKSFIAFSLAAT